MFAGDSHVEVHVVLSRASGVLMGMALLGFAALAAHSARTPKEASPITIDYPEDGSVFPPELLAPTFLFRDPADGVAVWRLTTR